MNNNNNNPDTDERKARLFAIKKNNKTIYIGKSLTKEKKKYSKNTIQANYHNKKLRNAIVGDKNIKIKEIKSYDQPDMWYSDKIREVVKEYEENGEPLLNADFLKEGKRSYWHGKPRDGHTLNRLSESKHKRVVQYDVNGNLVKVWDSIKEAATKVFKDYEVVNGSSKSTLYGTIKSNTIKFRFKENSYWFSEEELLKHFSIINIKNKKKNKKRGKYLIVSSVPIKLNIGKIEEHQKNKKKKIDRRKIKRKPFRKIIKQYKPIVTKAGKPTLKLVKTYPSMEHAYKENKCAAKSIRKSCLKLEAPYTLYKGYVWRYADGKIKSYK